MNGFGFIEYEDAMDARDVVPGMIFSLLFTVDLYLSVEVFDAGGGQACYFLPVLY